MSASNKIIQAAAGNAGAGEALYVEDVFSTYLYTGNDSALTVTNDIDLDGEGGLVVIKNRAVGGGAGVHPFTWCDTNRGPHLSLWSDRSAAASTDGIYGVDAYNSDGFSLVSGIVTNRSGDPHASWTFRKAPKFFDVVTYTGTGSARTVSHNLGSVPGCIIVKRTDNSGDWQVYHRSNTANPETDYLVLNSGAATVDSNTRWNDTAPTDSVFTVGTEATVNASGGTYVAYLFAHNDGDGEFGENADQDIIKCGSYVGNGTTPAPSIDLGFEPEFVLIKCASAGYSWRIFDVLRGIPTGGLDPYVEPNSSAEEAENYDWLDVTSTGFNIIRNNVTINASGETFIYIAIRRGLMKTPESGTDVFAIDTGTSGAIPTFTSGFPVDMGILTGITTDSNYIKSRLTGDTYLLTNSTNAEATDVAFFDNMDGWENNLPSTYISWMFRRAPGFFDVVTYTGDGVSGRTVSHNLGVPAELIITKRRDSISSLGWIVSSLYWFATTVWDRNGRLNLNTSLGGGGVYVPASSHSATEYPVSSFSDVNASGGNYIAYLFATLPGVSKVGSYTGNGTSQTIDCGFSTGARFVMTRRANDTGNWNIWDSERGIVAGNDPRLELNTADAQDTGHDYIDPDSSGFIVNYIADDNDDSNVSGDTYIFLAIA